MRIVFLGDSLTWGGYGGDFVAIVAEQMPEHEIINAGAGGSTVLNLLERLDDVLAAEPDLVFVMVGGNDAISHAYPDTRPYYKSAQKVPDGQVTAELFAQTYRQLLTDLQLAHVQTLVALEPGEYSPELSETMAEYNRLAREAAEGLAVPVLDLPAHLEPETPPKQRPPLGLHTINLIGQRGAEGWDDYEAEGQREGYSYTFDGLHLTPEGARRLAELVVPFIRENL